MFSYEQVFDGVVRLDDGFAIDPDAFGDDDLEDIDEAHDPGFIWRDSYAPFLDSTDYPWLDGVSASEGGGL